jgi:hypothetical protein
VLGIFGLQERQQPTSLEVVTGPAPVATSTAMTQTSAPATSTTVAELPAEPSVSAQPAPPVSVTTTPAAPGTTVQWTPQVSVETTTAPPISVTLPSRTADPTTTASAAPTTVHKAAAPTTSPTRHKGPKAGSASDSTGTHDARPAASHPIKTKLG